MNRNQSNLYLRRLIAVVMGYGGGGFSTKAQYKIQMSSSSSFRKAILMRRDIRKGIMKVDDNRVDDNKVDDNNKTTTTQCINKMNKSFL